MPRILTCLKRFGGDESGRVAVEYVVAGALIVVFCIYGIMSLGNSANQQNNSTSNLLQQASTPSSS